MIYKPTNCNSRFRRAPKEYRAQINPASPHCHANLYYHFEYSEGVGTKSYDKVTNGILQSVFTADVVGGAGFGTWRIGMPSSPALRALDCEIMGYAGAVGPTDRQRWTLPDTPSVNDFTFIFDGYYTTFEFSGNYPCIAGYLDGLSYQNCFLIYAKHAGQGNSPWFASVINSGATISQTFSWSVGERAMLAVVRRSNNIEYYKNGVLLNTPAASGSGATTLTNGNLCCSLADANYCSGAVYQVMFYKRALSAAELVGLWFDPYGLRSNPHVRPQVDRTRTAKIRVLPKSDFMPMLQRFMG